MDIKPGKNVRTINSHSFRKIKDSEYRLLEGSLLVKQDLQVIFLETLNLLASYGCFYPAVDLNKSKDIEQVHMKHRQEGAHPEHIAQNSGRCTNYRSPLSVC